MKTVDKKEYIEREALIALFNERYDTAFVQERTRENQEHWRGVCAGLNWGRNTITDAPTADVVEVRHGDWKWGYQNGQYGIWCTNCGAGWTDSENAEWIAHEHDYCPKCGADMRKTTIKPTVCANCGNEMYFTDGTCHYCGAKVDRKDE